MSRADNQKRLVGLVRLFGIPISRVAKLTGMSRTFVSRIINGDSSLGNDLFYRQVELMLPEMVRMRDRNYFDLAGVAVEELDRVIG